MNRYLYLPATCNKSVCLRMLGKGGGCGGGDLMRYILSLIERIEHNESRPQ